MSESRFELSKKVFVGNVPFDCTSEEFVDFFKTMDGFKSGDVISRKTTTGSRGFGFVEFETVSQAQQLVKKTDLVLKDRVLRFTEYNLPEHFKRLENLCKVFVRGLDKNITTEQVKKVFSSLKQDVKDVHLNVDKNTNKCSGSGWVLFNTREDAEKVLELESVEYEGQKWSLYKFRSKSGKKHPKKNYKHQIKQMYNSGYEDGYKEALKAVNNTH